VDVCAAVLMYKNSVNPVRYIRMLVRPDKFVLQVHTFLALLFITFVSGGIATSVSKQVLSFFYFQLLCLTVPTPWFHSTVIASCSHKDRYV
jgi:hypothetical protein